MQEQQQLTHSTLSKRLGWPTVPNSEQLTCAQVFFPCVTNANPKQTKGYANLHYSQFGMGSLEEFSASLQSYRSK